MLKPLTLKILKLNLQYFSHSQKKKYERNICDPKSNSKTVNGLHIFQFVWPKST
jgi:hypothetical protein